MDTKVFNSLMTQTVGLGKIALDQYGQETVTQSFSESGFIEYKRERGIDAQGEEIEYNAKCFLKSDSNIDASHDRWQVTDQHTGRAMEVVDIQPMRDPRDDTLHHYELKTR